MSGDMRDIASESPQESFWRDSETVMLHQAAIRVVAIAPYCYQLHMHFIFM